MEAELCVLALQCTKVDAGRRRRSVKREQLDTNEGGESLAGSQTGATKEDRCQEDGDGDSITEGDGLGGA